MSAAKSQLIKKLAKNYPNFLKKDIDKIVEIFITEMKNSLRRKDRIELRDNFSIEPKLLKARNARNPKTNEKIFVKEKYSILFKTSKMWSEKINEEI